MLRNARTLYVHGDAKCADFKRARKYKMRGPYMCAEIQNARNLLVHGNTKCADLMYTLFYKKPFYKKLKNLI